MLAMADLALECFIGWLKAGVLNDLDSLTATSLLEKCPCIQAVCQAVQETPKSQPQCQFVLWDGLASPVLVKLAPQLMSGLRLSLNVPLEKPG